MDDQTCGQGQARSEQDGRHVSQPILSFLYGRVALLDDPRSIGEALQGAKFGEFWKYRVEDYRIIATIRYLELEILLIRAGDRREVYR